MAPTTPPPSARYGYRFLDDRLTSMEHLARVLEDGVVQIGSRTIGDVVKTLTPGPKSLKQIYQEVLDSGVVRPEDILSDDGYGQARWKRDVRNALQRLKDKPNSGITSSADYATYFVEGSAAKPKRATLVLLGSPTEISLVLCSNEKLFLDTPPVNFIIADPDYQLDLGTRSNTYAGHRAYARDRSRVVPGYVGYEPDKKFIDIMAQWLGPAVAAMQPGANIAIITGPEQSGAVQVAAQDAGLTFVNQIAVRKPFPLRTTQRLAFAHQVVNVLTKGPLHSKLRYFKIPDSLPLAASGNAYPQDIWLHIPKYERPGLLRHENQLQPRLVDDLYDMLARPGELVVDPMLGGGQSAIVAWARGHPFIGGDINPDSIRFTMGRMLDIARQIEEMLCYTPQRDYAEQLITRFPVINPNKQSLEVGL